MAATFKSDEMVLSERILREPTPAVVPVAGAWNVVVCGGGPSRIAAAISAARQGARTLLIEQLTSLGDVNPGAHTNTCCDIGGGRKDRVTQDCISGKCGRIRWRG